MKTLLCRVALREEPNAPTEHPRLAKMRPFYGKTIAYRELVRKNDGGGKRVYSIRTSRSVISRSVLPDLR